MKEEWIQEAVKMRRTLHRYPELSEHEFKTTAYIQEKLTEWGKVVRKKGLLLRFEQIWMHCQFMNKRI